MEALAKQTYVEYLLDTLLSASIEERAALIIEKAKDVNALEQRIGSFAAPAYAYVESDINAEETTETAEDESADAESDTEESASEDKDADTSDSDDSTEDESGSSALTPDGNLTLVDDIGTDSESGKQFITVVTKSGNVRYR